MRRIAECKGKWVLYKVGREYWYVTVRADGSIEHGCLNEQSTDYNAINALGYMEQWNKADWLHASIKHM